MKQAFRPFTKYIPPAILAVSLMTIYIRTMAPGLSWANSGFDGGDLITAAATRGVAHPTGYPTYLILAQLFQLLPFGSLAYRTNLMSATAVAMASVTVYSLVTRSLSLSNRERHWSAGLVSGFAMGLSPLIWSQAVIAEVYGLQALFVTLILYLSTDLFLLIHQKRLDCLRGLSLGLAMGNHLTTILLVPIVLLVNIIRRSTYVTWWGWKLDWKSLLRQSIYLIVGLLVYLLLPLRAISNPPLNWGNPVTLNRLWWLVSGQLYQSYYLQFDSAEMWQRTQASAGLLIKQFGLPGVVLGLTGLVIYGSRSRLYILTCWIAAVSLVFAICYRSNDSYLYLIPLVISFAIWMGLGIGRLVDPGFLRLHKFRLVVGSILLFYLLGLAASHWSQIDASHDTRAESFGKEVLATAPQNAIIFAKGDAAVFSMWYFHYALRERPDIMVIASDLLHFDWYQETLRSVYPSLVLPGPFPWPETVVHTNPKNPVCYVQYSEQAVIDCRQPENNH